MSQEIYSWSRLRGREGERDGERIITTLNKALNIYVEFLLKGNIFLNYENMFL